MQTINHVTVVIPALNEGPRIAQIVQESAQLPSVKQIIVCNNGSSDNTHEEALKAGATVIDEPRQGYGSACLAALSQTQKSADAVLFINADGAEIISEASQLLQQLENYDLVVGSRTLGKAEPMALLPQQRFGNALACFLIYLFWQVRFTDLGPFRVIRMSLLKQLNLKDRDFGWIIEMQLKSLRSNARIHEVPVTTRRSKGPSKISGTLKGSILASVKILGPIFYYGLRDFKIVPQFATQFAAQLRAKQGSDSKHP